MSTRGWPSASAGEVEATLLALAGLKRLGLTVGTPVPEDEMLPAVGQGAVCIECRVDDARMIGWLAAINHAATATCVAAEHAMLAVLDGSCRTPIAGHAILDTDGALYLRGLIAKPDGSELIATERARPASRRRSDGPRGRRRAEAPRRPGIPLLMRTTPSSCEAGEVARNRARHGRDLRSWLLRHRGRPHRPRFAPLERRVSARFAT